MHIWCRGPTGRLGDELAPVHEAHPYHVDRGNLLTKPLLHLSLFFKRHRDEYYRWLNAVRTAGDWENWHDFFLDEVAMIDRGRGGRTGTRALRPRRRRSNSCARA